MYGAWSEISELKSSGCQQKPNSFSSSTQLSAQSPSVVFTHATEREFHASAMYYYNLHEEILPSADQSYFCNVVVGTESGTQSTASGANQPEALGFCAYMITW